MKREFILIVVNDAEVCDRTSDKLNRAGYHISVIKDGNGLVDHIKQGNVPDLVIVDEVQPGTAMDEIIKSVQHLYKGSTVPMLSIVNKEVSDNENMIYARLDDAEFLSKVKVAIARDQEHKALNPLTGLPSGVHVQHMIKDKIDANEKFAVLFIDIDGFKYYNDIYGFKKGDEVIEFLADIMISAGASISEYKAFIGHGGGDDFIVLCQIEHAEKMAEFIVATFADGISEFYFPEDRNRGYTITEDRKGTKHKVPLMTLSIGIVTNEMRQISTVGEISEIGDELKRYLKEDEQSNILIDRRKG